ncbi:MAG: hypothetical protein ACR2O4_11775 [Hyphomicrobiaceae bacterium]
MANRLSAQGAACGIAVVALVMTVAAPAKASGLDREECSAKRSVRDALENLGVREDMTQGPAWAAANLPQERIDRIKTYVLANEQILFRCISSPRSVAVGMEDAANMPHPKPRFDRRVFPLPVRKPRRAAGLRLQAQ